MSRAPFLRAVQSGPLTIPGQVCKRDSVEHRARLPRGPPPRWWPRPGAAFLGQRYRTDCVQPAASFDSLDSRFGGKTTEEVAAEGRQIPPFRLRSWMQGPAPRHPACPVCPREATGAGTARRERITHHPEGLCRAQAKKGPVLQEPQPAWVCRVGIHLPNFIQEERPMFRCRQDAGAVLDRLRMTSTLVSKQAALHVIAVASWHSSRRRTLPLRPLKP